MPFIAIVRPALYSMKNVGIRTVNYTTQQFLSEPVKNMLAGISPYYTGFRTGAGVADYFDGKMDTWLAQDLALSMSVDNIKTSPYLPYLIGIGADDGDEMFGFGAGDALPTLPPSHNNPHLSWLIATMSPVQTASAQYDAVYSDTTVHTKKAWHDALVAEYGTIGALNSAWGSNYSTFDSSGTPITTESIGTGNGSKLTFFHTLRHLTPSEFSVQILVNGSPAGGDLGNGTIFGPNLTTGSAINYTTGVVTVDFAPGSAPTSGATIAVNYIQNGWGIGSGLMDEDGRPSHQAWLGSDPIQLTNTNPNVKTDFDTFLRAVAGQYLGMCNTEIKKAFPNTLFLGPDSIGSFGAPARAPVLQAAAQYVDVLSGPGNVTQNPGALDYIAQYFGDKPILDGQYRSSQADSPWASYPVNDPIHDFSTQQARGQDYYNTVSTLQSQSVTATGSHPFIGESWWQYTDNRSEKRNWGLVTLLDNAYDGHEDVMATVLCSPPLQAHTCGGETSNYGDVITSVRSANFYWLTH